MPGWQLLPAAEVINAGLMRMVSGRQCLVEVSRVAVEFPLNLLGARTWALEPQGRELEASSRAASELKGFPNE